MQVLLALLLGCAAHQHTACLSLISILLHLQKQPHPSLLTVLIRWTGEEKIVGSAGLGLNVQISQSQNKSLPLRDCDSLFTHSVIGISPWIILRCHRATVLRGHYVPTAITWKRRKNGKIKCNRFQLRSRVFYTLQVKCSVLFCPWEKERLNNEDWNQLCSCISFQMVSSLVLSCIYWTQWVNCFLL